MPQPIYPEFAAFQETMPDLTLNAQTLPSIRKLMPDRPLAEVDDSVEIIDHTIDTGEVPLALRVYNARAGSRRPCVYYIHGGGYILGSHIMDDPRITRWCASLDCMAASIEYRVAPEHPYPAPLEDCYAGLRWVHEHAGELGADTDRIGLAGVSAGGGLAAALALLARDRGELPVAFQLLECPMLDDRQRTPSSQEDGLPIWSRESNTFGWQSYLGELYGGDVPYHAAPARATDLAGLPPAFVAVGTVDGFRDEDVDYATRLNQAGVPTELHVYPGVPHGFGMMPNFHVSVQAARDLEGWLGRQFAGVLHSAPVTG